jgi:hypothetical protein
VIGRRYENKGLKIACINTYSKEQNENENAFQRGVDYKTDVVNYVLGKTK